MNRVVAVLVLIFTSFVCLMAQSNGYFLQFADKEGSLYTVDRPEEFLSERAIDRRVSQNIDIVENDLPVSATYINALKELGVDVRYTTKWLNGAVVFSSDNELMDTLVNLNFVSYVEMTTNSNHVSTLVKFKEGHGILKNKSEEDYGYAWDQIQTVNGYHLHDRGFDGKGMQIAVLDAGFYSADNAPSLQHLWDKGQILGYKDFVNPNSDFFTTHSHGMKVLSIMGGEIAGSYLGTAPGASYWLLRTEDAATETPVEPDYWVCAAEYADSVGVDVINSSLGYYEFDSPFNSYTYEILDGTSRASRAAEIAASKGMVVVISAGNEGADEWHYIGVPADAKNILSVGAMQVDSTRAYFSSYGPSYDQRIKPEVSALGYFTAVQSLNGGIEFGAGTSYSAPVIAGLVACLWQALPNYTSHQLIDLIISHASNFNNADNSLGYGVPNFNESLKTNIDKVMDAGMEWNISPNPFSNYLLLQPLEFDYSLGNITISLFDVAGNAVFKGKSEMGEKIKLEGFYNMADGLYILVIESAAGKQHYKVMKN